MPPSSRSLIHLISALRRGFGPCLPTESPPPVLRSWLAHSLACLPTGWLAGCSVFRGRRVSGSDCAGGREVNWKKLRCSHRRAEARGNKLDISPIHVGWRVYTISPAATVPRHPPSGSPFLLPHRKHTHLHPHFLLPVVGQRSGSSKKQQKKALPYVVGNAASV